MHSNQSLKSFWQIASAKVLWTFQLCRVQGVGSKGRKKEVKKGFWASENKKN